LHELRGLQDDGGVRLAVLVLVLLKVPHPAETRVQYANSEGNTQLSELAFSPLSVKIHDVLLVRILVHCVSKQPKPL
jgi:hypothetical protein